MNDIVGVLAYPLDRGHDAEAPPRRSVRRAYRRSLRERSNPRPREYMEQLFAERYPGGRLVDTPPAEHEGELVLLYPDAIGVGFGKLERRLPAGARVVVLNGRRRSFALDPKTLRALRLRRALERTFAVEAGLLAVGAVATPFLLLADLARGRR